MNFEIKIPKSYKEMTREKGCRPEKFRYSKILGKDPVSLVQSKIIRDS